MICTWLLPLWISSGDADSPEEKEVYLSPEDPLLRQIPTVLHLRRDYNVFVIKPDDWIAEQPAESGLYYYVMDGLREHPRLHLVPRLEDADVILHLVLHTNITADERFLDSSNEVFKRLVVIDENDYFENSFHRMFDDYNFLAFFKRSYVRKRSGDPIGIDRASGSRDLPYSHWPMRHNYLPFSYGIARRYIAGLWDEQDVMAFDEGEGRDIPVVCTLREYHKPAWPGGRENVSAWLTEMDIQGAIMGEVSDWQEGNRHQNNRAYLDVMRRAQIVVTANPGDWEGDFRLWEAIVSKALIFIDYMCVYAMQERGWRHKVDIEKVPKQPSPDVGGVIIMCCLSAAAGTCRYRTSFKTAWMPSSSMCMTGTPSETRSLSTSAIPRRRGRLQ
jgi:hypothetical protein